MIDKYLEAFVEKIKKVCETYESLIIPYGSKDFCIQFIKNLAEGKSKHDSSLAEFIINLTQLWKEAEEK